MLCRRIVENGNVHDSNLEYLVNDSNTSLGDGTFYVCPARFEQLYKMNVLNNSMYVQVVYCLLLSKTKNIYENMWYLITLWSKEFKSQMIILYFDLPTYNGFLRIFLNSHIKCFQFLHLGQAWYR